MYGGVPSLGWEWWLYERRHAGRPPAYAGKQQSSCSVNFAYRSLIKEITYLVDGRELVLLLCRS